jgi:hypothetical protein
MRDRTRRFGRARGPVAVVAAALVLVVVASALADDVGRVGGIKYSHHSIQPTAPTTLFTGASCPGHTHVIGGGFSSDSLLSSPAAMFPAGNPGHTPDTWAVTARVGGSGMQTVHSYAICEPGAHSYPKKKVTVKAGKARTAKVSCDRDEHVLDGGITLLEPGNTGAINSSYPFDSSDEGKTPDDGWKVRVSNGSAAKAKGTAFAVCRQKPATYRTESLSLPAGTSSAAIPACPTSKHVLGMGIKLNHAASEGVPRVLAPRDLSADADSVTDDDVIANASNAAGAATTKKLTGYAVCGKHG